MIGRLILLIAFLIAAVTIIRLYRNTPPSKRRGIYWKLGLSGIAIALVLLAATGRIHWIGAAIGALLPFVRRALPALIRYFPLLQQLRQRHRQPPPTGGGRTSQVNTRILKMTLDQDSNRLYGEVIAGPFAGRNLDSLELAQLQELLDYCHREEKDSAQLLLNYLNQRFGNRWQQRGGQSGAGRDGPMDESAAYAILGLKPGATRQEVVEAHRRMMQRMHPDRTGVAATTWRPRSMPPRSSCWKNWRSRSPAEGIKWPADSHPPQRNHGFSMSNSSNVFVVTNQNGHFLNKHREWVDGREPRLLFRSPHKDEAINLVFEMSSKDIDLRAEAVNVPLNEHNQPQVEVTNPIEDPEPEPEAEASGESGENTGH